MGVRILEGDVRAMLKTLPDESVHCIWTSIPYWGLRSYGTVPQSWPETGWTGEHGLEPTLEMWLQHEVLIWRDLRRVLRKDGVAWLNCGDAYATAANGRSAEDTKAVGNDDRTFRDKPFDSSKASGLKSKQRLMLPARVALALQGDGWWLRDEIVWFKANPMPSSVQDRTTPAHEMLYMLTKSARYYYDNVAIMEPMADSSVQRLSQPSIDQQQGGAKQDMYEAAGLNAKSGSRRPNQIVQGLAKKAFDPSEAHKRLNKQDEKLVAGEKWGARHEGWKATAADRAGRNKRSVWPLATEPFPDAHFATAPTALVEPCIKAGTSEKGCCPKCGAPWRREIETDRAPDPTAGKNAMRGAGHFRTGAGPANREGREFQVRTAVATMGWAASCACNAGEPIPCTVLEPFLGSGTTAMVTDRLGRHCIGIELNPEYAAMARRRIKSDAGMFAG